MPEEKLPPHQSAAPDTSWRGAHAGASNRSKLSSRRQFQTALLAGVFLALATSVVVWILTLRPPPAEPFFLSITIGDYNSERYPTVAFARQDSERLSRHFEHRRDAESKTRDLMIKELGKLAAHAGEPLVLHISALSLVHGDKVYVLPVDADPEDSATWLPLEAVLDAVGRCREPKLLILDLAHPLSSAAAGARLGVLEDRVAELVEAHLKKNPPSFLVLVSCSTGQHSQTSEILQAGSLAYYLDRGLRGEADGWGADGKIDQAIGVKELFAYAAGRVDRWAHINRQCSQQPQLFGQAEDFTLLNLQRSFQPKEYKTEPAAYPRPLTDGWETRDNLARMSNWGDAAIMRDLDGQLLRQEKRWMAGADIDEARITRTIQSARTAADTWRGPNMSPFFLGLAIPENKGSELLMNTIRNFLSRALDKDENQAKLPEAIKKRLDDEYKEVDSLQMTWAVSKALAQSGELDENQVRLAMFIVGLRAAKSGPTSTGFMETLYLLRLTDFAERLKDIGWNWRPIIAQQLFKTMRAQQAALTELVQSPSQLRFVRSLLEEADSIRQAAEKKILWSVPSGWEGARNLLITSEEKYASVQRLVNNLSRCRQACTEAQVFLAEFAPLLCDWPEFDGEAVDTWNKAAEHQGALGQLLRDLWANPQRASSSPVLTQLNNHRFELGRHVTALTESLQGRIDRALKRPGTEVVQQARCLLNSSALSAKERAAVRDQAVQLAKELQARTDHEDEANQRGGTTLPALPKPRYPWDAVKRANLRERVSKAPTLAEPNLMAEGPPWRTLVGWLEMRYRQEADMLMADESKERPVIGAFYRDLARNLARLK